MIPDLPLLELDPDPHGVVTADEGVALPPTAVLAFLYDVTDDYAAAHQLPVLHRIDTVAQGIRIYGATDSVAVVPAPFGAPAAVAVAEVLIANGVRNLIAVGSCGALRDLPENQFLVPTEALRDEGTSLHYLPAARWITTDSGLRSVLQRSLTSGGVPHAECKVWTTDAIYRETPAKVAARRDDGCDVVDMECSALSACAQFRGVRFAQLLYTADSVADTTQWQERGFGADSREIGLRLALQAAAEL